MNKLTLEELFEQLPETTNLYRLYGHYTASYESTKQCSCCSKNIGGRISAEGNTPREVLLELLKKYKEYKHPQVKKNNLFDVMAKNRHLVKDFLIEKGLYE